MQAVCWPARRAGGLGPAPNCKSGTETHPNAASQGMRGDQPTIALLKTLPPTQEGNTPAVPLPSLKAPSLQVRVTPLSVCWERRRNTNTERELDRQTNA